MSFHKVKILKGKEMFEDSALEKRIPQSRDIFDTYDLSFENFIHTASVVFRNVKSAYTDNKVFRESPAGDYILFLYLSLYGKIKLQNDCMGVYRVHEGGIWSLKNNDYIREQKKHYLELLIDNFEHESKKNFINRYFYVLVGSMGASLRRGRIKLAIQFYFDGLKRIDKFHKDFRKEKELKQVVRFIYNNCKLLLIIYYCACSLLVRAIRILRIKAFKFNLRRRVNSQ